MASTILSICPYWSFVAPYHHQVLVTENLPGLCDAQTQSLSKQSVWAALEVARKQTLLTRAANHPLAQRSLYWESMLTPVESERSTPVLELLITPHIQIFKPGVRGWDISQAINGVILVLSRCSWNQRAWLSRRPVSFVCFILTDSFSVDRNLTPDSLSGFIQTSIWKFSKTELAVQGFVGYLISVWHRLFLLCSSLVMIHMRVVGN